MKTNHKSFASTKDRGALSEEGKGQLRREWKHCWEDFSLKGNFLGLKGRKCHGVFTFAVHYRGEFRPSPGKLWAPWGLFHVSFILYYLLNTFTEHLLCPWHKVGAEQHNRDIPLLSVARRKERRGGREDRRVSRQGLGFLNGRRGFVFSLSPIDFYMDGPWWKLDISLVVWWKEPWTKIKKTKLQPYLWCELAT